MRFELHSATARSALAIMEDARGLQAGHGSRLFAQAADGLRRIVARVMGDAAPRDAGDPA